MEFYEALIGNSNKGAVVMWGPHEIPGRPLPLSCDLFGSFLRQAVDSILEGHGADRGDEGSAATQVSSPTVLSKIRILL